MPEQRKIFISYRRADNPDFADRIRDWFIPRYGRDSVFMDFDSIPPGVKFVDHIRASMQQSDAVIVIIGPRWVELFQERIAKGEPDFVRIELGLAIELEKPITPICISGAPVPTPSSLPPELRPLLDYNIAFLDRTNFYERIERIIAAVETELNNALLMAAANHSPVNESISQVEENKTKTDAIQELIDELNNRPYPKQASPRNRMLASVKFNLALTPTNEQLMSEVLLLDPQHIYAYNNRGIARRNKRDYEGAIADYTEAIRLKPLYAEAYYNRSLAREAIGDTNGAAADFKKYLELIG